MFVDIIKILFKTEESGAKANIAKTIIGSSKYLLILISLKHFATLDRLYAQLTLVFMLIFVRDAPSYIIK
jgi:hypothetical protein